MKKTIKLLIVLVVLITLTLLGINYALGNKEDGVAYFDAKELNLSKEYQFDLVMVGDALIHESVYKDALNSDGNYDFTKMFTSISDIIGHYDLAFYNQETILGGVELGLSTYPCFNSPQSLGDNMVDMGFNIVSLANNHTLDRGVKAITNSVNYWKDKDVVTAGSYTSFEDRNSYNVYECNGITYGFLAYTYGTNGILVPDGKDYLVNIYNEEMLREDCRNYRDKVDFLIVSMHWGDEYTTSPNENQKYMANVLAEENVDLVIGTHSHCVQPIEWIDDTLIYYSLGNLISGQDTLLKKIGGIGAITVTKRVNGKDVDVSITNVAADLIYTDRNSSMRDYHVLTFDDITDDIMTNKESVYKQYTDILRKLDNNIQIGVK